jgi:hypothetical protein
MPKPQLPDAVVGTVQQALRAGMQYEGHGTWKSVVTHYRRLHSQSPERAQDFADGLFQHSRVHLQQQRDVADAEEAHLALGVA